MAANYEKYVSEEKLTTHQRYYNLPRKFAFESTPSFSSREITRLKPAIQSNRNQVMFDKYHFLR